MKVTFLIVLSITAVVLLAISAAAQAPSATPAGNAANGKALFLKAGCYECHGTQGQGGTGPHLGPNPIPLAQMLAFVRKPQGMPAYSAKVLSDAELTDIRAYLSSVPAPAPTNIPLLNQ